MFSSTLMPPKNAFCWKVRRRPARGSAWAGLSVTSVPASRMRPPCDTILVAAMKQVLFPAPFGR